MARLFQLPRQVPLVSGVVSPGAKANFFLTGTTTPTNTFTDSALGTPHANPVIANAAGEFATIYLDPDVVYKLTLDDTNDALIYTEDPIQDALTSANVQTLFSSTPVSLDIFPTTADETTAGVTIVDFSKEVGNVLRYGENTIPGTTDMTAAIQAAIDVAVIGDVGAAVYLPKGIYKITSTLLIGISAGTRINGFHFYGDGFKATEIVWTGGTTGTGIEVRAIKGAVLERFYLRAEVGNEADVGIHINGGTNSGPNDTLYDVTIDSFKVGLRAGDILFAKDSIPNGAYYNVNITNATIACVEIIGPDTDGQFFYNLDTGDAPIAVYVNGGRNVHVYGGTHSNSTGVGQGEKNFVYMRLEGGTTGGTLSGGSYSIRDLRIEGGVRLLEVGNLFPWTGQADDEHINFLCKNVYHASKHAEAPARPRVLNCAQNGTYIFENCHIPQKNSYFHFYNIARANRFAELFLIGCGFSDASDDPDIFGNLIYVNGNGVGGIAGGLRAYLKGNLNFVDAGSDSAAGIIRNRELQVIPDDADLNFKNINAATQANPCQITTTANHGYLTGDKITIIEIVGMTELNDDIYTITFVDATNFTLDGVDATGFTAYSSAGQTTRPRFRAFKDDGAIQTFEATDLTPSIAYGSLFQTGAADTYTDFDDIQTDDEGKRISILAKHAAVVTNGANIKTSTGANKTLVVDRVYNFISIAGVWYEDATV